MPKTVTPGIRNGAKKVDPNEYLPRPGEWQETHVIHDFGDGWKICEDRTEYDRRLNAMLTLTCVNALHHMMDGFDAETIFQRFYEQEKARIDIPFYRRNGWDDAKIEEHARKAAEMRINSQFYNPQLSKKRPLKLLHLRDPENRPRACILMGYEKCVQEHKEKVPVDEREYPQSVQYITRDDLGQKRALLVKGRLMRVLEARVGTGNAPPQIALEYLKQWYLDTRGEWSDDDYNKAGNKRSHYAAVQHYGEEQKALEKLKGEWKK